METISVDHERNDMLLLVILGMIMFGASLWLLYAGLFTDFRLALMGPATSGVSILAGGIGTLFFGYAFFYILYRFLFPKGALIINDKGIIDKTSALGSRKVIPYENMEEAKLEMVNSSPQIGINLKDDQVYYDSLPWLKRKTAEINKKHFGTSTISLNVPVDSRAHLNELIDIMNERREIIQRQMDA